VKKIALALACAAMLSACVSYQSSQPLIENSKVMQIQKGVTTRPEVEALFGPPAMVGMGQNGERLAMYSAYQTSSTGQANGASYIPIVGPFVGTAKGTATRRQQMLQIQYSSAGVVKDYEFSDTASNTQTTGGIFGYKMETTPVKQP
jgi:outer membrane protein assembly factor BamE (lipoprotein component of BamABCDE complex)